MEQRQVIANVSNWGLAGGTTAMIAGLVNGYAWLTWAGVTVFSLGIFAHVSLFLTPPKSPAASRATVPLYLAMEWLGLRSTWASRYKNDPNDWMVEAERELRDHAAQGLITAWGTHQQGFARSDYAPSAIPKRAWASGKTWYSDWTSPEPPTSLDIYGEERYRDVRFSQAELQSAWPRRSLFSRLAGRSPIERSGPWKTIKASEQERRRRGLAICPGEGWRQTSVS